MPTFFEFLHDESEPAVRVVWGRFLFVYIQPYFDGNGRIGRFLMNLMFALEAASVDGNIAPFAKLLEAL